MSHLFEGVELAAVGIDVVLVDLVGEDEEVVLVSKLDDVLNVLPGKKTIMWSKFFQVP